MFYTTASLRYYVKHFSHVVHFDPRNGLARGRLYYPPTIISSFCIYSLSPTTTQIKLTFQSLSVSMFPRYQGAVWGKCCGKQFKQDAPSNLFCFSQLSMYFIFQMWNLNVFGSECQILSVLSQESFQNIKEEKTFKSLGPLLKLKSFFQLHIHKKCLTTKIVFNCPQFF